MPNLGKRWESASIGRTAALFERLSLHHHAWRAMIRGLLCIALARAAPMYTPSQMGAAPKVEVVPRIRRYARHCLAEGDGYVYAQHLRKAGGTLLRMYLAQYRCEPRTRDMALAQRYALKHGDPRPYTAPSVVQEQIAFNTQNFVLRPQAVYVTLMRHPIDRVESMYFFEGRWPQRSYQRTPESAVPLERWLRKVLATSKRRAWGSQHHLEERGAYPLRQRIWDEVSEYYVQIFSGVAAEASSLHLEVAKSVLDNFDVVLILEKLKTETGRREAEQLLQSVLTLPASAKCPPQLPLRPVNAGSVRRTVEPLSREDRLRIIALNPLDLELYKHAVLLNARGTEAPHACPRRVNCTQARDRDLNLLWGEGALRSCGRMTHRCRAS